MGLYPVILAEGEKIVSKIDELKHTVKFQSKKAACLGTAVGNVNLSEDQIRQNVTMSINYLVSLMKKGWQNVGTLNIKTSMGRAYRIFGWFLTYLNPYPIHVITLKLIRWEQRVHLLGDYVHAWVSLGGMCGKGIFLRNIKYILILQIMVNLKSQKRLAA